MNEFTGIHLPRPPTQFPKQPIFQPEEQRQALEQEKLWEEKVRATQSYWEQQQVQMEGLRNAAQALGIRSGRIDALRRLPFYYKEPYEETKAIETIEANLREAAPEIPLPSWESFNWSVQRSLWQQARRQGFRFLDSVGVDPVEFGRQYPSLWQSLVDWITTSNIIALEPPTKAEIEQSQPDLDKVIWTELVRRRGNPEMDTWEDWVKAGLVRLGTGPLPKDLADVPEALRPYAQKVFDFRQLESDAEAEYWGVMTTGDPPRNPLEEIREIAREYRDQVVMVRRARHLHLGPAPVEHLAFMPHEPSLANAWVWADYSGVMRMIADATVTEELPVAQRLAIAQAQIKSRAEQAEGEILAGKSISTIAGESVVKGAFFVPSTIFEGVGASLRLLGADFETVQAATSHLKGGVGYFRKALGLGDHWWRVYNRSLDAAEAMEKMGFAPRERTEEFNKRMESSRTIGEAFGHAVDFTENAFSGLPAPFNWVPLAVVGAVSELGHSMIQLTDGDENTAALFLTGSALRSLKGGVGPVRPKVAAGFRAVGLRDVADWIDPVAAEAVRLLKKSLHGVPRAEAAEMVRAIAHGALETAEQAYNAAVGKRMKVYAANRVAYIRKSAEGIRAAVDHATDIGRDFGEVVDRLSHDMSRIVRFSPRDVWANADPTGFVAEQLRKGVRPKRGEPKSIYELGMVEMKELERNAAEYLLSGNWRGPIGKHGPVLFEYLEQLGARTGEIASYQSTLHSLINGAMNYYRNVGDASSVKILAQELVRSRSANVLSRGFRVSSQAARLLFEDAFLSPMTRVSSSLMGAWETALRTVEKALKDPKIATPEAVQRLLSAEMRKAFRVKAPEPKFRKAIVEAQGKLAQAISDIASGVAKLPPQSIRRSLVSHYGDRIRFGLQQGHGLFYLAESIQAEVNRLSKRAASDKRAARALRFIKQVRMSTKGFDPGKLRRVAEELRDAEYGDLSTRMADYATGLIVRIQRAHVQLEDLAVKMGLLPPEVAARRRYDLWHHHFKGLETTRAHSGRVPQLTTAARLDTRWTTAQREFGKYTLNYDLGGRRMMRHFPDKETAEAWAKEHGLDKRNYRIEDPIEVDLKYAGDLAKPLEDQMHAIGVLAKNLSEAILLDSVRDIRDAVYEPERALKELPESEMRLVDAGLSNKYVRVPADARHFRGLAGKVVDSNLLRGIASWGGMERYYEGIRQGIYELLGDDSMISRLIRKTGPAENVLRTLRGMYLTSLISWSHKVISANALFNKFCGIFAGVPPWAIFSSAYWEGAYKALTKHPDMLPLIREGVDFRHGGFMGEWADYEGRQRKAISVPSPIEGGVTMLQRLGVLAKKFDPRELREAFLGRENGRDLRRLDEIEKFLETSPDMKPSLRKTMETEADKIRQRLYIGTGRYQTKLGFKLGWDALQNGLHYSLSRYSMIDIAMKGGAAGWLLNKGFPLPEVGWRMRTFFQNYEWVPPAFKRLSSRGLGLLLGSTITTFPYEFFRLMKNFMTYRPMTMAAMAGGQAGWNMAKLHAGGWSLDDWAVTMGWRSGMDKMVGMMTNLVIDANPEAVTTWSTDNITAMNMLDQPVGLMRRTLYDFARTAPAGWDTLIKMAGGVATRFVLNTVPLNQIVGTAMNIDTFTGKNIWDPDAPSAEKAVKGIKYFSRIFVPPIMPPNYLWDRWTETYDTEAGRPRSLIERIGEQFDWKYATRENFTSGLISEGYALKHRPVDIRKSLWGRAEEIRRTLIEIQSKGADRTPEQRKEAIGQINESIEQLREILLRPELVKGPKGELEERRPDPETIAYRVRSMLRLGWQGDFATAPPDVQVWVLRRFEELGKDKAYPDIWNKLWAIMVYGPQAIDKDAAGLQIAMKIIPGAIQIPSGEERRFGGFLETTLETAIKVLPDRPIDPRFGWIKKKLYEGWAQARMQNIQKGRAIREAK